MAKTAEQAAPTPATEAVRRALTGRRVDLGGLAFQAVLLLALLLALAVLVTLLTDVLQQSLPVFRERGTDFLRSNLSSLPSRAGVAQGIFGSIALMAFVVLISVPLGIGAAIYLEEYAKDNTFTRFINSNVRNLAGVPSVVYGLLGLAIFVQLLSGVTGGRTLMSGGLTIAILVLPIVTITTAEAIRAVPTTIREAGYGVGATRWEVIRSHVLPYSATGILTGTILSISRALGEAAPLILIGGAPVFFAVQNEGVVDTLQGRYTALPAIIYTWSRKSLRAFGDSTAAAIIVLMVVLLVINATAIWLRNRYERKW
jgi:phosphate transport system permease protein